MEIIATLSQVLLLCLGIFLMIVVLLQRGRGGGLAGAFGGLGGQSAFGTKAGDVFTKITVVVAVMWVLVAGGSGYLLRAVGEGTRAQDLPEGTAGMRSADPDQEDLDAESPVDDPGASPVTTPESDTDAAPVPDGTTSPPAEGASDSTPAAPDTSSESGAASGSDSDTSKPAEEPNDTTPEGSQP